MAPIKCYYHDCTNTSLNHSIFRFPIRNQNRLRIWLENAGNPSLASLTDEELRNRFLCEAHFDESSILSEGLRKQLRKDALPQPYFVNRSGTSTQVDSPILKVRSPTKMYRRRNYGDRDKKSPISSEKDFHFPTPTKLKRRRLVFERLIASLLNRFLCEAHFDESSILSEGLRKQLRKDALPQPYFVNRSGTKAAAMTELDKFKRRMIRSVARLLLLEKKPEEEVWEELKKETGCDCKLLWYRMRALTMKKMKRLLAADDRSESIASVARLSLTDWRLFDLVLVHEKIDVIGRDVKTDFKALIELFSLVQRFHIEELDGEKLAENWSAATVYYNSQGRQCSPMLLQRRWYQLKEQTRYCFYKLWNSYRGNQKLWDKAQVYKPTRLQMAIARRFPHIITEAFPEWEELIQKRLVILPEEFEEKMRKRGLPAPCNENDPDIVLVEPVIETIELAEDSDAEENIPELDPDKTASRNPMSNASRSTEDEALNDDTMSSMDVDTEVTIKQEPIEELDGLSNVKILATSHISEAIERDTIESQEMLDDMDLETSLQNTVLKEDSQVTEASENSQAVSSFMNSTISGMHSIKLPEYTTEDSVCDDLIKEQADDFFRKTKEAVGLSKFKIASEVSEEHSKDTGIISDDETFSTTDALLKTKADEFFRKKLGAITSLKRAPAVFDKNKDTTNENDNTTVYDLTTDDLLKAKADEYCKKTGKSSEEAIASTMKIATAVSEENKDTINVDDNSTVYEPTTDDLLKAKADEYCKKSRKASEAANDKTIEKPYNVSDDEDDSVVDDIIKQKADDFIRKSDTKTLEFNVESPLVMSENITFVDEGIEFVDDGIEYVDEEEDISNSEAKFDTNKLFEQTIKTEVKEEQEDENEVKPKFDLKLLMDPLVYTTKLNNMSVFKGKDFNYVKDNNLIDCVIVESKPVSKRSIKVVDLKQEDPISQQSFNISSDDLKTTNDDLFKNNSCDEYDSDIEISEDKKVKTTSYLLQKPRSRSYNPIQLCKNPDFNTRLKRLTVGFFSSTRNRQLLKACKPLTIDLHKAFEMNLLNGTLYLKSSGSDVAQQLEEDNKKEQTVSVLPSTMAIQSLMDNTKINNNIYDLIASSSQNKIKETEDEERAERNKVINLRDITEIRRINQRLLTAEVTPMRIQNNDTQTPAVHSNIPKIDEFDVKTGEQIDSANLNLNNVESSMPGVCQTNEYPASVKPTDPINQPLGSNDNSSYKINLDTIKQTISKTINIHDYEVRRPTQGRPPGEKAGSKPDKTTPGASKMNSLVLNAVTKAPVPWNKPNWKNVPVLDEFLITIDTLNKMLNKINGTDDLPAPGKKKNKKTQNWIINKDHRTQGTLSKTSAQVQTGKEDAEDKLPKLKKTIPQKKTQSNSYRKKEKKRYCCWSREKIDKLPSIGRNRKHHTCPLPLCKCCCRDQLIDFIKILNTKNVPIVNHTTSIVLSDDEDDVRLQNACKSIETVVQQSNPTPPTPVVRVHSKINNRPVSLGSVDTPDQSIDVKVNSSQKVQVIGEAGIEISYDLKAINMTSNGTEFCTHPTSDNTYDKGPLHLSGGSIVTMNESYDKDISISQPTMAVSPLVADKPLQITTRIASDTNRISSKMSLMVPCKSHMTNVLQISTETQTTDPTSLKDTTISDPSRITRITPNKDCSPLKRIVIDGSKYGPLAVPALVPTSSPVRVNEKVLFLNSKNISKKPAQSPIFLGKNKILLTSVKLPRDIKNSEQKVEEIHPTVIPTLPLPNGVQLLLMPNGELTYTIEPGIELDESQLAALPTIMAAVQQQINVNSSSLFNAAPTTATDDVIKLSDDENDNVADKFISNPNPDLNNEKSTLPQNLNKDTGITSNQEIAESISDNTSSINKETGDVPNSAVDTSKSVENAKNEVKIAENIRNEGQIQADKENPKTADFCNQLQNIALTNKQKENTETESSEAINITEANENTSVNLKDASKSGEADKSANNNCEGTSRNLLSDLMEMSGISAEDTKHVPQETTSQEPVLSALNSNVVTTAASSVRSLPELSPITSLAELKYACEQNGRFFKLDFETGVIVPINVCIKRNPKAAGTPITLKSVIDLTDDVENSEGDEVLYKGVHFKTTLATSKNQLKKSMQKVGVKPVRLVKVTHPSILKRSIGNFNKDKIEGNVDIIKPHGKRKRKQTLGKVEININMVDSDVPMEEEYLIDSSDSETEYLIDTETQNSSRDSVLLNSSIAESDDSSDDEPLAKKFKRIKDNVTTKEYSGLDENKETEATADVKVPDAAPVGLMEQVNMETEYGPEMSFVDQESDNESQEDCILGV